MLSLDGSGNVHGNRIRRLEQHGYACEADAHVLAGVADGLGIPTDAREAEPRDQAAQNLRKAGAAPLRLGLCGALGFDGFVLPQGLRPGT